ncbi:MAG: hypothetical protein LBJ62_09245 [Bifidobacteriaceae bacterium]|nr:hypothetical protein [Bifidobacteriaceae bacterium]
MVGVLAAALALTGAWADSSGAAQTGIAGVAGAAAGRPQEMATSVGQPQDAIASLGHPQRAGAAAGQPQEADSAKTAWVVAPVDDADGTKRTSVNYNLAGDGTMVDGIVLTSNSDVPLDLRIYAVDGRTGGDGQTELGAASQPRVGAGNWITFGRSGGQGNTSTEASIRLTLAPGASATVPFQVTVPADASPGDYAAGLVTALAETQTDGASQGNPLSDPPTAVLAYVNVAGPAAPALQVTDVWMRWTPAPGRPGWGRADLRYKLANTGNTRLIPTERVSFDGWAGIGGLAGEAADLPELLPGSRLDRAVTLDGVFAVFEVTGRVSVGAALVSQQDDAVPPAAATGQVTLRLAAWFWLGLVLIVVACLAGLASVFRGRRRRRQATVLDGARGGARDATGATRDGAAAGRGAGRTGQERPDGDDWPTRDASRPRRRAGPGVDGSARRAGPGVDNPRRRTPPDWEELPAPETDSSRGRTPPDREEWPAPETDGQEIVED